MASSTISLSVLSLLLLLLTCSVDSATISTPQALCPAGKVRSNGMCKPCPAGTYRAANSANKCVQCPPGTSSPFPGTTQAYLCRECYPGTFAKRPGSQRCFSCPAGKSSGHRSTGCVRCPPGTAISFNGATCEKCDSYSFSSAFNSVQCEMCLTGTLNFKRTKCEPCKTGQKCANCPTGLYFDAEKAECEKCPQGSSAPKGATMKSQCAPCAKGTAKGRWDETCYACPNGMTGAPSFGAMACKTSAQSTYKSSSASSSGDRVTCPRNYFLNQNGVCITCLPGQFRSGLKCLTCPSGSASAGGLNPKCSKCTGNSFVSADSSECTCADGTHLVNGACVACAAGKFRNNDQHVAAFGCEPCKIGWVSGPKAAKCEKCALGTIPDSTGSKCISCPMNKVPNVLSYIDLYYEHGQSKCIDARTGNGQGEPPVLY